MYSRSRLPPAEDRYTSSIPPLYSGNRFRNVRRERAEPILPVPKEQSPDTMEPTAAEEPVIQAAPDDMQMEGDAEAAESAPAVSENKAAAGAGFRQEDRILLGILLLLSAEHEHAMDMIVILLLLLGIR